MTKKPAEHPCPVCGKMTTNPKMCSKECVRKSFKMRSSTGRDKKLSELDNTNRCAQCKKPMPLDRYSMYCEECEMHIEETY